jgi:hypothetical protein
MRGLSTKSFKSWIDEDRGRARSRGGEEDRGGLRRVEEGRGGLRRVEEARRIEEGPDGGLNLIFRPSLMSSSTLPSSPTQAVFFVYCRSSTRFSTPNNK